MIAAQQKSALQWRQQQWPGWTIRFAVKNCLDKSHYALWMLEVDFFCWGKKKQQKNTGIWNQVPEEPATKFSPWNIKPKNMRRWWGTSCVDSEVMQAGLVLPCVPAQHRPSWTCKGLVYHHSTGLSSTPCQLQHLSRSAPAGKQHSWLSPGTSQRMDDDGHQEGLIFALVYSHI